MDIGQLKHKLMARGRQFGPVLVVALLTGATGLYWVRMSGAATHVVHKEAEAGTVAGNDGQGDGNGASNGASVKFGVTAANLPILFGAQSAWNMAANGNPDPRSAAYISSGDVGSLKYSFTQTGKGFDIAGTDDYPDYGVPLYRLTSTQAMVQVKDKYGWWGGGFSAPIPPNAKPATGTDHHLAVWDIPNHTMYEFWEMAKNTDGTWTAGAGAKFDTNGPGYQSTPWAVSARAYGGSLISGAILYEEMKAGVINHALGMAYPWTLGRKYAMGQGTDGITQNIATHSDNAEAANRNGATNIPEGARFRLKSSVDINARCGSKAACKVIGTALKKYGSYVVDTAGVATFYAEVLTDQNKSWSGVLNISDAQSFQADDFELLALPANLTNAP